MYKENVSYKGRQLNNYKKVYAAYVQCLNRIFFKSSHLYLGADICLISDISTD